MLSISNPIRSGFADYLGNLAREDYYTAGGEPQGRWVGATKDFELYAPVDKNEFKNLLQGFSAGGKFPLVQNPGAKRQGGWDLCFSAPKSVSVFWSQANDTTRQVIQICQQRTD